MNLHLVLDIKVRSRYFAATAASGLAMAYPWIFRSVNCLPLTIILCAHNGNCSKMNCLQYSHLRTIKFCDTKADFGQSRAQFPGRA